MGRGSGGCRLRGRRRNAEAKARQVLPNREWKALETGAHRKDPEAPSSRKHWPGGRDSTFYCLKPFHSMLRNKLR